MRIQSPSMSELHAFVAAARTGSFTRAAEQLCVTQGAISRAVARLESHYNQTLIRRNAHGLELTSSGRDLLASVEGPLAQIEGASAELRRGPGPRELVLSTVPTLASVWLMPRLPDFARRHPDVRLKFVPYRKDEDFSGATPHAAILPGAGPTQWPRWDCTYLIGKQMVPVCHADRARTARWRTPAELMRAPLLYHTTAPGNWTEWLRLAGVKAPRPNLASGFDQVSILIQAAMTDMGVALVQRCLIGDAVASGRLQMPFDLPISLSRGYYLCAPGHRSPSPALLAFRDWLVETAQAA
ncbi:MULTISPECIES: LysR substrate-binding domain-containing protein [unclassified Achromobacter]|uniref:LysR substrate-binding domain-containing protein n=1 Tax=unclassified Achromobacter TaxID=2626865 RepID=UPI000B51E0B3|nr:MULTISPECIES: LysR substrate-binding domain-containing protein [unclassified Achromobacter]OWT71491.1 LysR family transcriptional regulator [Achromobacter sp. HZ34]OWT73148.1 LysR family transcriptional regulator [Achromobacter sp. HZ28]